MPCGHDFLRALDCQRAKSLRLLISTVSMSSAETRQSSTVCTGLRWDGGDSSQLADWHRKKQPFAECSCPINVNEMTADAPATYQASYSPRLAKRWTTCAVLVTPKRLRIRRRWFSTVRSDRPSNNAMSA